MNFIRNRNFRAGPQTSLEGFICPQNSDKQQKIKVFGRSGGQIEIFDFLRFPLICIVVLIHTLQADEHVEFGILYHDALYFFQESIGRSAVPVFFVISGYMFFYKVAGLTTEIYKSKLKRRVKSLLIPYLIWNALALLECCIKHLRISPL